MKNKDNIEIISSKNLIEYEYSMNFMESKVKNIFSNKSKELI